MSQGPPDSLKPTADEEASNANADTPAQLPAPIPESLPEQLGDEDQTYFNRLSHYLTLTLSLPERSARALSALVGGSTYLLSETLLPSALRNTSSYRFTLGMFQTFLIRNVAGIDSETRTEALQERFVQRKLLGTSLETAGLLTMHLSPVWIFAIASDAAKGGQVFLQRLVSALKENKVISEDSSPESLEQILQAIHDMGRQGATAIDTPPLSTTEIKHMADELRASTVHLTRNSAQLLPRFESLWNQINLIAQREKMSVEQILGILSVHAASATQTGLCTVGAVGKTGYQLIDEVLIADYKQTLDGISEVGAWDFLRNNMSPFLNNAQSHFDFSQETRTERWLKSVFRRIAAKIRAGE